MRRPPHGCPLPARPSRPFRVLACLVTSLACDLLAAAESQAEKGVWTAPEDWSGGSDGLESRGV